MLREPMVGVGVVRLEMKVCDAFRRFVGPRHVVG